MNLTNILQDFFIQYMRDEQAEIGQEEDLITSGLLDSLGIIQLVSCLEETFSLHIPEQDITLDNFRTVARISRYLGEAHHIYRSEVL